MAKYDQGGGCPCGLYKDCVCVIRDTDLSLEPPKEKTYTNHAIKIPEMGSNPRPSEWQMILNVAEAMEVNRDLNSFKEENARMKVALTNIFHNSVDPDAIRRAAMGLGWK